MKKHTKDENYAKNTGEYLESSVYVRIKELIDTNNFIVSQPNVQIFRHKKYYSKDRQAYITADVSVEKYLANPEENPEIYPSLIVIIECKDYKKSVPVDDVEEFHAKLQQIGADNTKGIMFTSKAVYQKSALNYAKSKGICLARFMPPEQVSIVCYSGYGGGYFDRAEKALTEEKYKSDNDYFYCSGDFFDLYEMVGHYIETDLYPAYNKNRLDFWVNHFNEKRK